MLSKICCMLLQPYQKISWPVWAGRDNPNFKEFTGHNIEEELRNKEQEGTDLFKFKLG